MNRILAHWKNISVARKIYFVVGTMATLITCELFVLRVSMEKVSAVRAFVSAEALWSKSEKDALLELKSYQRTQDERNYQAFLAKLKVPEGDHLARLELLKPHPDLSVIRAGFLQGQIHPDDLDRMVTLLRRFYWISYVSQAISDWTNGDTLLQEIRDTATHLHDKVQSHDSKGSLLLLEHIDHLNTQLTPLEDHFSFVLGEGSRWLESTVLSIFLLMVLIVEATGLTLTVITGREIAGIATENERLFKEAKESLEMRDEFLSVASHELKTPLTALGLQLQLLHQLALKPSSPESTARVLTLSDQSLASVKRLSTLLGELLDLTRIRIGHFELHHQNCNLTSIVQDSVAQLGAEAAKSGSVISIKTVGPVVGSFDSGRISQVIINLLSNAIKYGQGKPIAISISTQGTKARIAVQDHGMGIPADKLPKLFQRYERFEQDPSISGLGLGLYISNKIIIAHRGTLVAESHLNEGATFTVELDTAQGS
jgi:two-component system, sensor histidine kinase